MKLVRKYKFSDKNMSVGGIISTLMGIFSLVCIGYAIYLSFRLEGNGGVIIGGMGLAAILLSAFGCAIGFISFKEKEKYYLFSKIGSMMCGIITVFMIMVYLMGLGL